MTSPHDQDQNAQSDQGNDVLIAPAKPLDLDDRGSEEACRSNGCKPIDRPDGKEFPHLKVRVNLRDDKEYHCAPGVMAAKPPIDADTHQTDGVSNDRPAGGRRLFSSVAFGLMIPAILGVAFAWQFYGDKAKDTVRGSGTSPSWLSPLDSTNWFPSSEVAVGLASKTSARLIQDIVLEQATPAIPSAQVSSPELQNQLETLVSDVAAVRHIVERLAAVQEQMALDIATQTANQPVSLPAHPPAVLVPPRKDARTIAHSAVIARSPHGAVPAAPTRTPLALH